MKRLGLLGVKALEVGPAVLAFSLLAGCATQTGTTGSGGSSGTGGGTGTTTSTTTTTTTSGGGNGGEGGAGGTTTTTTTTTTVTTGAGGTGGTGGSGGAGGAGGEGGSFMPPVGTADYPAETEQNNLKSTANPVAMGTKGFTASIWPPGDVDVFAIQVTVGGSSIQIAIGDGMGGCPAGAATYLRVINAANNLLASDFDSGPAACSLLKPTSSPSLQGLGVGTYYAIVESANSQLIPMYVLDVQLGAPACGDAILQVQNGEQCDDGNMMAGDGCSPACQLEGNFTQEAEPNDDFGTAQSLDGIDGVVASIDPVADGDYYKFDVVVPGSSVTLKVTDGNNGCPAGFDSKLYLYDAAQVELTHDDDGAIDHCSAIDPLLYPNAASNLPVGTYYVKVEEYGNNALQPFYVLEISLLPPSCGDGLIQSGEQCDDHNVNAGDGCSATCQIEGNYIPETEPNDTQNLANVLGAADGFIGAIQPIGDLDYFKFDVTVPGSSAFIEVSDGVTGCPAGFDSKLSLFNPMGNLLATDDNGGVDGCSKISPVTTPAAANLAVGTYVARVEQFGGIMTQPSYVVKIHVVPPGCGDAVVQAGEQCDDGNVVAGDGCDATCHVEPPYEIEPNNTQQTATPVWPGFNQWKGAIMPVGDHDYYTVVLPAPATVTFITHSVNDIGSCPGDTLIHLTDSAGNQLQQDDDSGVFPCSKITKALQAGTFYLWVQRFSDSQAIPAYQLDYSAQ
ncbi:MAG: DUF4215 domain-containing protein [Byssovorax sp.]